MKIYLLPLILFGLIITIFSSTMAQDTTQSLAFRNNKPDRTRPYFYRPDLAYQIWQQFRLTREANTGDPLAQHELGLRYLIGEGVLADTAYAVYWIKKSADQNLTSAKYNYAILLMNGMGVEWNPFAAFKYFKSAAEDGMVQAQYIVGVHYTDNLTVKRDWNQSYYWIKKSADGKYEPAVEILSQIEPRISREVVDSLLNKERTFHIDKTEPVSDPSNTNLTSSLGLVFIDFDTLSDTVFSITDSMLIADLDLTGIDSLAEILEIDSVTTLHRLANHKNITKLITIAENGSPEAQSIIGRLYEQGIYFNQNYITAASYYFRALRNDSQKATHLLWKLASKGEFQSLLQAEVKRNNVEAKFAWYALSSIGFDGRIAMNDALNLLEESAADKYLPALMELGLNYYTGRFISRDDTKGLQLWENAELLGSIEATVRISTSTLFDLFNPGENEKAFANLLDAAAEGSLLAQVSLALCYEEGIGTLRSRSDAIHHLRLSAQRGSQFAYAELKRLYDEIRPDDSEFVISN
ncbi:MAG: sel1 repeat family protein [Ignavibacteria bacterium]|nr:sel1 repeat family protein [Ignavibacteria bacterium]